jgi:hypothetical protein
VEANRTYKGFRIFECEQAKGEHSGKWVVQTYYHKTGTPWAESECPHFRTLTDARDAIEHELVYRDWR